MTLGTTLLPLDEEAALTQPQVEEAARRAVRAIQAACPPTDRSDRPALQVGLWWHYPHLRLALADPDPAVRRRAAAALGRRRATLARGALRGRLRADPDPGVRAAAARALGALRDERAVPLLIDALGAVDTPLSHRAIEALGRIATPRAVRALTRLIARTATPKATKHRAWALEVVSDLGLCATPAAPALTRVLADERATWRERATALRALARLRPAEIRRALPAIVGYLRAEPTRYQAGTVDSLSWLGPTIRGAIPALRRIGLITGLRESLRDLNVNADAEAVRRALQDLDAWLPHRAKRPIVLPPRPHRD